MNIPQAKNSEKCEMTSKELQNVINGYIEALFWSEGQEFCDFEMSVELKRKCKEDCINFVILAEEKYLLGENDCRQLGIDFALTRNGHGAGFWDGGWTLHGDELTELAQRFLELSLYVGNDDLIYFL